MFSKRPYIKERGPLGTRPVSNRKVSIGCFLEIYTVSHVNNHLLRKLLFYIIKLNAFWWKPQCGSEGDAVLLYLLCICGEANEHTQFSVPLLLPFRTIGEPSSCHVFVPISFLLHIPIQLLWDGDWQGTVLEAGTVCSGIVGTAWGTQGLRNCSGTEGTEWGQGLRGCSGNEGIVWGRVWGTVALRGQCEAGTKAAPALPLPFLSPSAVVVLLPQLSGGMSLWASVGLRSHLCCFLNL